jgi:hypothetical protein
MRPRQKAILYAAIAVVIAWVAAVGGHAVFKNARMTADKLRIYLSSSDLSQLRGEARARALRELADKVNALSAEERRKARMGHLWNQWFSAMTDEEKAAFLEATLPTGFKQMMTSFEALPAERRQKTIENALKRLREERNDMADAGAEGDAAGDPPPPVMSEELQKKVAAIGLNTVYSSASAQTKAELAPLLEELQRNMDSGRLIMHGGGR